jgi:hypothetical protein
MSQNFQASLGLPAFRVIFRLIIVHSQKNCPISSSGRNLSTRGGVDDLVSRHMFYDKDRRKTTLSSQTQHFGAGRT